MEYEKWAYEMASLEAHCEQFATWQEEEQWQLELTMTLTPVHENEYVKNVYM